MRGSDPLKPPRKPGHEDRTQNELSNDELVTTVIELAIILANNPSYYVTRRYCLAPEAPVVAGEVRAGGVGSPCRHTPPKDDLWEA